MTKHDDHPTDRYEIRVSTDTEGDNVFLVLDKVLGGTRAKFWDRNEAVVWIARRVAA